MPANSVPDNANAIGPSVPTAAEPAVTDNAAEIIVTGSRLVRAGYDAPTPVNVVGEQRLQQLGITSVADALNQIPSFRATNSPANNSFRVSGNIAGRTLDLRGLGATRTLVLLDGRRFIGSSDQGTVDLNAIPSILIQRSEVVTGGASAAYGANAVAGVVNLITDSKLKGIKAEASNGISERGDARQTYLAVAAGTDFGGGRGHIIFGAEYQKESSIGSCEDRSWCSKYTNYVVNPGYNAATRTSTNGLPATLVLDHTMFVYNENGILVGATKPGSSPGSTITLGQQVLNVGATSLPAALRNKQFDEAGNLVPYTFGNYLSGTFQQFPHGDPTQPYLLGFSPAPLLVPVKHHSAMARANYELTDAISVSAEMLYSRVVGGPTQSGSPVDSTSVGLDNPYLSPATVGAVRAADPAITRLLVNHGSTLFGAASQGKSFNNTYRAALSFKGDLGHGWA
jgi:outer membrane receptor protein involved in Fe transport